MKSFYVIAYDISDDRKRTEISDLLSTCGVRANKSVFECLLTPSGFRKIRESLTEKLGGDEDSILYYRLCRTCREKIERSGKGPEREPHTVKVV